jgi:hypothetical protein
MGLKTWRLFHSQSGWSIIRSRRRPDPPRPSRPTPTFGSEGCSRHSNTTPGGENSGRLLGWPLQPSSGPLAELCIPPAFGAAHENRLQSSRHSMGSSDQNRAQAARYTRRTRGRDVSRRQASIRGLVARPREIVRVAHVIRRLRSARPVICKSRLCVAMRGWSAGQPKWNQGGVCSTRDMASQSNHDKITEWSAGTLECQLHSIRRAPRRLSIGRKDRFGFAGDHWGS